MNIKYFILSSVLLMHFIGLSARENLNMPPLPPPPSSSGKTNNDCLPAATQFDMEVNNIRARILTGGDMWWDPVGAVPHYEVPKLPKGSAEATKNAIYAGALWIGGIDDGGQLKIAAQTYRQTGNDFFPGVLDDNGNTDSEVCNNFDRVWTVFATDIDKLRATLTLNGGTASASEVPEAVLLWPGRNNPHFSDFELPLDKDLAPFWDENGDGDYDPTDGDYPVIDSKTEGIYADQMVWWAFNDKGNTHSETGGEAIGLEVSGLAFAFATNDEVNNMTFYKYIVDNKSTIALDSTYFGQWVDPDLGDYLDDFVGCIPEEGLGIVYNCDNSDGVYGSPPPMLGVDFFKGPNKIGDFDGDGTQDTIQQGMSSFTYYDNNFTITGNPETASHFYGYLAGVWKDGTPFVYGGNGYGTGTPYPYQFPNDPSDTSPEAWSECKEGNECNDRRFLQTSGPFRLEPGAVNDIIVGVVFVPEAGGCPNASFEQMRLADRKAQALFDSNFKLKDGPDAPDLVIRELNRELIITLSNDTLTSNNAKEQYEEVDAVLKSQSVNEPSITDTTFRFEGYKVYQLKNISVSASEYNDPSKAQLIALVDLKNGVTKLINWSRNSEVDALVPTLKVDAKDSGISHSFRVTNDLFAPTTTDDKRLINNQRYYFSAVAYAYNGHAPYHPDSSKAYKDLSQLSPYLEGRNNIKKYEAIPHIPTPQNGGMVLSAEYGDGPEVKVIQGYGNGKELIELSDASMQEILNNGFADQPVYKAGFGPINVKIYDPLLVPAAAFRLEIANAGADSTLANSSKWVLKNLSTNEEYRGETPIEQGYEQVISGAQGALGFDITVAQRPYPSGSSDGFISGNLTFDNPKEPWLSAILDNDGQSYSNWQRSGISGYSSEDNTDPNTGTCFSDNCFNSDLLETFYDPNNYYKGILGGAVSPYCLTNAKLPDSDDQVNLEPLAPACSDCTASGAGMPPSDDPINTLSNLSSVDVVLTDDPNLWTRCIVVEMSRETNLAQGGARKNGYRHAPSLNRDGSQVAALSESEQLQPDTYYYVVGSSAGQITYGGTTNVATSKFFKITGTSPVSFTSLNGAKVYLASNIGRSYFPGYAIDINTCERLNMMFAENSFYGADNGADMIWNPSDRTLGPQGPNMLKAGGEHYIYVMKSRYDEGNADHALLTDYAASPSITTAARTKKRTVYNQAMWVFAPLLATKADGTKYSWKSMADGLLPGDGVTLKLRTEQPYREEGDKTSNIYEFDLSNFAAKMSLTDTAKSAMDLIRIVPNPYYAFSTYEADPVTNRVRITNLPSRANISIFTTDGTLIKTLKVDNFNNDTTLGDDVNSKSGFINSIDWDITNYKNVPLASGMYLIHIEAPDLGEERTLKWLCIKRPIDLDLF
jgi:hypothetical protein